MTYVRTPSWVDWQDVTNAAVPPMAWRIPRVLEPIPVPARIVWLTDGEEWVDGLATRWTATWVQVEFRARRLGPLATWVAANDVRRYAPGTRPSLGRPDGPIGAWPRDVGRR